MQYTLSIKFKPEFGAERIVPALAELDVDPLNLSPQSICGAFIGIEEDQIIQFELDQEHIEVVFKMKKYKLEQLDRSGMFTLIQGW